MAFLVAVARLLGMLLSAVEARVLDWQPQRRDSPMRP